LAQSPLAMASMLLMLIAASIATLAWLRAQPMAQLRDNSPLKMLPATKTLDMPSRVFIF